MAIRANSKEARNGIRKYIKECYEAWDEAKENVSFDEMARDIMDQFENYCHGLETIYNMQEYFEDWLTGLPSVNIGDFYNRSYSNAIDILGEILKETEEERNKYSYEQAEKLLTSMLYKELLKGIKTYERNKKGAR